MKIDILTNINYVERIKQGIINKEEVFLYGCTQYPVVLKGQGDIDEQYCKNNNIEIYSSFNAGGTIIMDKGDIDIVILKEKGWDIGKYLGEQILQYLQAKAINVSLEGNDILVDGIYKVASYSSINLGDAINPYIYTAGHISINPNLEMIKCICKKEMVKIPKGLGEYGITTEEMVALVLKIAKNIN